uniref:Rad21_Rec8_N domain-containing protein n=1 Tax=Caenorhabditis japonica TaxID=281687 RepID=A0A8R1I4X8_CAEJA
MVVSADVIKSSDVFHVAWLLGTGGSSKLSRRKVLEQNLPELCDSIVQMVPQTGVSYKQKTGLYLLSVLTYGTVLIHRVQVDFLQKDAEKLKDLVRKKSFILMMAEQFDREQESMRKREKRAEKMRSEPILCVEDIDNWVNLADLPVISEQLGINGDARDFTMTDALPNQRIDWEEVNAELVDLYGTIDQFPSHPNNMTIYSTFVEGNGSDENRERRNEAILMDFEGTVMPQVLPTMPTMKPTPSVKEDVERRSAGSEMSSRVEVLGVVEVKPVLLPEKPMKFAECTILHREQKLSVAQCTLLNEEEPLSVVQCNLLNEENLTMAAEATKPVISVKHTISDQPVQAPTAPQLPEALDNAPPRPLLEDWDLPVVPPHMQEQVMDYLNQISNLQEDQPLPPPPQDLLPVQEIENEGQPPAKKLKTADIREEEEEEEELERERRRASSRPVTPLTPLNQTNLTNLTANAPMNLDNTTLKPLDLSFDIEPEIRDVLPHKKRSKKNLPPIYGDDMEIDVAIQKALQADFSSLVRKFEDVKVHVQHKKGDVELADLLDPAPFAYKMSDEIRDLFKSGRWNGPVGTLVSDEEGSESDEDEEDEETAKTMEIPEKYVTISLLSPPARTAPDETTHLIFDGSLKPVPQEIEELPPRAPEELELLPPPVPLQEEEEQQTLKYASAKLHEELENMKYSSVRLIDSPPPSRREMEIIEELQLEPLPAPITNNFEVLDFSHQNQTARIDQSDLPMEDMENVRRRHKSSLGIRSNRMEQLEEEIDEEEEARRIRFYEREEERRRSALEADGEAEDDIYFVSSGSLLPSHRFRIHDGLLKETRQKFPEPVDFNQFTERFSRKEAAIAFEGLLLALKNQKVTAEQLEPFGPIKILRAAEE